ncbi:hypothetical protein [Actinomyces faecalis]|uniref:hypothetical protein n=1 Tax=Actinomyces faecalis TaxID=2722820 RepID=UPI001554CC17|nr:hypothetical protein [Actinomyces faecalis]
MSRLVERGPHTVTVTPTRVVDDGLGRVTEAGEPVTVTGVMVQPSSASASDLARNQVGSTSWRILGAGTWPGGPYSTIRVDTGPPGVQGRVLDQAGEALQRGSGHRTSHFVVTATARGAEVA